MTTEIDWHLLGWYLFWAAFFTTWAATVVFVVVNMMLTAHLGQFRYVILTRLNRQFDMLDRLEASIKRKVHHEDAHRPDSDGLS